MRLGVRVQALQLLGAGKAEQWLKAYHAPEFKILTAELAKAELRDKALPGDADAQRFLKAATELAKRSLE
jgi:hypothetical protein